MSYSCLASAEFTTLCQSQMALLNTGLGAVWTAVYLTEELNKNQQAQLYPFAIYPQTDNSYLAELPAIGIAEIWPNLTSYSSMVSTQLLPTKLITDNSSTTISKWNKVSEARRQLILPLVYKDMVMGVLVAGRKDRDWKEIELNQAEEIARTLAIARFLEIQYEWSQEELLVQQNLRRIERDRIDDLLHQLRNPLTALRTFSKLLIKRLLPEDPNQSVAKSILSQSDRFAELLQQFEAKIETVSSEDSHLTLSTTSVKLLEEDRTTQGNFLLPESNAQLESLSSKNILESLLVTSKAIAEEKEIELTANIPENLPNITASFKGLREVLNNLIDNAIKYTPPGGKVKLDIQTDRLNREIPLLGIAIADTGYGINLQDRQRIFERHYRGIQAESDIPGSGLGLAIANELIEQMQGEIELISPNNLAPDNTFPGTTFIVWLPIAINQ